MIVDDEEIVRIILSENVKKMIENIEVLTALNGQEGLDLFLSRNQYKHQNNINLIITDIEMKPLKGH